jgi:hypothetical protein
MPTFPNTLPKFDSESYVESYGDGLVRTSMDSGPDFVRRRYTAIPIGVSGDLNLDGAQVDTLIDFWRTDCKFGSITFDWVNSRTDTAVVYRFRAPPVVRAGSGNNFLVSLELEILP